VKKRFLVVQKGAEGSVTLHRMKEWLRQHPDRTPGGMTPSNTSRQLLSAFRKQGWSAQETEEEVRLIPPEVAADSAVEELVGEADADEEVTTEEERFAFAVESHLRDFIAKNLGALPMPHRGLRLYSENGVSGVEFQTGVGRIDILATDHSGNFIVFELKLAHGPDRAMGQLLRYIGWVRNNLARGRQVFGVIVAQDVGENLRYAAVSVPNITLLEYELTFRLKVADLKETSEQQVQA
jgi:endonuclease